MRCYNGQPDKELQALMDDAALVTRQLAAHDARAVYFPAEGRWTVFKANRMVVKLQDTKRAAANAALEILTTERET